MEGDCGGRGDRELLRMARGGGKEVVEVEWHCWLVGRQRAFRIR